jgi:indolepyruvate ferredoxin oxidoreductase
MKTIQEVVESSATAMIDPARVEIVLPTDFEMPPGGVHIRWPDRRCRRKSACSTTSGMPRWPTSAPTG